MSGVGTHTYRWPSRAQMCTRRPPVSVMKQEAVL